MPFIAIENSCGYTIMAVKNIAMDEVISVYSGLGKRKSERKKKSEVEGRGTNSAISYCCRPTVLNNKGKEDMARLNFRNGQNNKTIICGSSEYIA